MSGMGVLLVNCGSVLQPTGHPSTGESWHEISIQSEQCGNSTLWEVGFSSWELGESLFSTWRSWGMPDFPFPCSAHEDSSRSKGSGWAW